MMHLLAYALPGDIIGQTDCATKTLAEMSRLRMIPQRIRYDQPLFKKQRLTFTHRTNAYKALLGIGWFLTPGSHSHIW